MQKDKKSKKRSIENLHELLDEASYKNLPSKNKIYLKALDKRLKKSSNDSQVYRRIVAKQMGEEEVTLEPKVTIYLRDGRKKSEFQDVKKEDIIIKVEAVPTVVEEKPEEKPFEDEDIIEYEKVEYKGPQFVEVKPKITITEEEEVPVKERKAIGDEELTEWEPVEVEKEEPIKEVPKPVEKFEIVPGFCGKCGAKLYAGARFCPNCGINIAADVEYEAFEEKKPEPVETIKPEPTFIPVTKVEEDEGTPRWEPIDTGEKEAEEVVKEEKYFINREDKIEVFRDMISIDSKTAVLLYDKGFTTVESLRNVTLAALINIVGIPKKIAKKIKKEINKKIKELAKIIPIVKAAPSNDNDIENMIKEDVLSKSKEEPAPVELLTKTAEWKPTTDIESEIFDNHTAEKKAAMEVFKDIKSIDEETAFILYTSGFITISDLIIISVKDLSKIKGIKRKKAIEIKKEMDQRTKPYDIVVEKVEKQEEETKEEEITTEFFEETEEPTIIEIDEKIQEQEEPIKAEEERFFEEKFKEMPSLKEDETEDVFKDIQSIDKTIGKLLIENGIDSVDVLKNKSIKELTKIRGIKKKVAKQIKKEIDGLFKTTDDSADTTTFETLEEKLIEEDSEEWESFDEKKVTESEKIEIEGFMHGDYTLYKKEIKTKDGKTRKVRFFSKAQPEDGDPIELPKGYEVKENAKTGLPYLKKKK